MKVLHYFGSSTRWIAQVNDRNDCIIVTPRTFHSITVILQKMVALVILF